MKVKFGGPMTIAAFYQAFYQQRAIFEQDGITHFRNIHLYATPCDEHGDTVLICNEVGSEIIEYQSPGAYISAADAYEEALKAPKPLEARRVVRKFSTETMPFSPL